MINNELQHLQDLRDLKPGWLDGEGEKISEWTLNTAADVILGCQWFRYPLIHVYPTPEGGVMIEWDMPIPEDLDFECHTLEFYPNQNVRYNYFIDPLDDSDEYDVTWQDPSVSDIVKAINTHHSS